MAFFHSGFGPIEDFHTCCFIKPEIAGRRCDETTGTILSVTEMGLAGQYTKQCNGQIDLIIRNRLFQFSDQGTTAY